jgi:putative DNA primase/helicase
MASTHATNEVHNDILDLAPFATVPPEHIIALKSTLFDLNTSQTLPFTEEHFFEYRFGFDYQPEAKCPLNQSFLDSILPDERDQSLVYEYLAHTLSPSKLFQQADLMFYGTGGNGKGTLARVFNAFVGSENWKTVSMEALEKNARFQTLFLIGRRVLCDPEMPPFDKAMYNVYKQTTGEDGISVEVKGGKIFDAIIQARYLILTNKPPRSELNDDSFFRRFAIVKFEKTIPPEQADARLTKKLVSQEELNGLFMKVYPLFAKIREQGRYTMGPRIEETRETYNLLANPISRFIKETLNLEPSSTTLPISKEEVFVLYRKWAKARKQRDLTVEEFHTLFRNDPVWDGRLSHHEGRGKTPRNYEGFEIKTDKELHQLGISVNYTPKLNENT